MTRPDHFSYLSVTLWLLFACYLVYAVFYLVNESKTGTKTSVITETSLCLSSVCMESASTECLELPPKLATVRIIKETHNELYTVRIKVTDTLCFTDRLRGE